MTLEVAKAIDLAAYQSQLRAVFLVWALGSLGRPAEPNEYPPPVRCGDGRSQGRGGAEAALSGQAPPPLYRHSRALPHLNSSPPTPNFPWDRDRLRMIASETHGRIGLTLALLRAYRNVVSILERELSDRRGLTVGEAEVMVRLGATSARSLRMVDLALACGLTRSGATSIVDRLVHRGLALREPNSQDGRSKLVVLSESGWETHQSLLTILDKVGPETWMGPLLEQLGPT
jgi:DNA-binding MarR family transcriptional regulator